MSAGLEFTLVCHSLEDEGERREGGRREGGERRRRGERREEGNEKCVLLPTVLQVRSVQGNG